MKNFIIIISTIIATSSCVSDNNIPDNTIEKIYINKEKSMKEKIKESLDLVRQFNI